MRGSDVKALIELLIKKGFYLEDDSDYLDFNTKVELAVIKFQKANYLLADGIVGSKTVLVLKK